MFWHWHESLRELREDGPSCRHSVKPLTHSLIEGACQSFPFVLICFSIGRLSVSSTLNMIAIPHDNRHIRLYDLSGARVGRLPRSSRQVNTTVCLTFSQGNANLFFPRTVIKLLILISLICSLIELVTF